MHLLSEGQIKCFFFRLDTHSFSLTRLHQHYCGYWNHAFFLCVNFWAALSSQVTYVTMVPRMGNETLRPLGVAMGNALSVTRVWRYICKNNTCWPATAHDVTTGVPQYKCRRENTSSASSSEACVRSMAQSLGDAVSHFPFGEPWLHT